LRSKGIKANKSQPKVKRRKPQKGNYGDSKKTKNEHSISYYARKVKQKPFTHTFFCGKIYA